VATKVYVDGTAGSGATGRVRPVIADVAIQIRIPTANAIATSLAFDVLDRIIRRSRLGRSLLPLGRNLCDNVG
jgi:hypothetical protein